MKKQYLNPKELNVPRFYSHAVTAEGARKLVYVSGQVSWDAAGNIVSRGDMRAQSEQVFVERLVDPDLLLEVEVVAAL